MKGAIRELGAKPGPGAARRVDAPSRDMQALWFALAHLRWTSLALVPVDEGGSAAAVATSLAEVGRRLHDAPVTFFVMADPIDYNSAGKIISAVAAVGKGTTALTVAPTGRVIVAVQPVVSEPLGLAVTQGADAVVLCVEMRRDRLAAARKTIELVGRDRIAGCLLLG